MNGIEVQVRPENTTSIAMLERLAFMRGRNLRQAELSAGIHNDMFQYSLLKTEWAPHVPPSAA